MLSDFDRGILVGILIGEGHFGGDGRQPQVTLRMHVRHRALFSWIERTVDGGRLYGPYNHDGRHYYQWMARGAFLRESFYPLLARSLGPHLDEHSWSRFLQMQGRYPHLLSPPPDQLGRNDHTPPDPSGGPDPLREGDSS